MAPLDSKCLLLGVSITLAALAAKPDMARAQAERKNATAVDSAVRTGQFDRAAAILQRAAEAGNPDAQYELASLYRSGRGVPQDDALAFRWMKAAAEKGHQKAQFNLGRMLLTGRGAALDVGQGRVWLQKAAVQGHEEATKLLAEIPSQVPAASRQARPEAKTGKQVGNERSSIAAQHNLEEARRNGRSAVLDAAWRGQVDAVRQLIANSAVIKARDEDGNTPLALAAAAGKVAVVEVLIEARAEINTSNQYGHFIA